MRRKVLSHTTTTSTDHGKKSSCPVGLSMKLSVANLLKNGFVLVSAGTSIQRALMLGIAREIVKTETYPSWTGPIALPRDSSVIRALVIDSVVLFMPPSCCFYHTRNQKFVSVNDKQRKSKERKMKIKKGLHETRRRALGLIGGCMEMKMICCWLMIN